MTRAFLALAVCLWAFVALPAAAQQYMVSERVGKKLASAQELMSAEQYAQATEILASLASGRLSDYERALVFQFRGYIASQSDDYTAAIKHFEVALENGALPPPTQLQLRFNLAQLYMSKENWLKAIANLKLWFAQAETPNAIAYYTFAVAYYQNGQKDEALAQGKRALALEEQPRESWLSLVLSLHLERSEYKAALPLLEDLVERFPKKSYWMQLSALYAELGQDEKSLAVQQLVHSQGLLDKQSELIRLARLYLYHDLPYRAASVVQKSIADGIVKEDAESLELLGQSWMAAREFDRAVDPMARAAALAQDGDLWLRLGQIHMEREEWAKASEALARAIAKGDLDDPGNASLLLGIAAFNQQRFDSARSAFAEAAKHERSKQSAVRWLQHVEREAKRAGS